MASGGLVRRERDFFATQSSCFYVLEVGGSAVGCIAVAVHNDVAELFNVCIAADWQGRGLGRLLLSGVRQLLSKKGCTDLVLFTKTAQDWFKQRGFTPLNSSQLSTGQRRQLHSERDSTLMHDRLASSLLDLTETPSGKETRVRFSRSGQELCWDGSLGSLLDVAEELEVSIDSVCRAGICGTCSSTLLRGTVCYETPPAVSIAEDEILPCIAYPLTDVVIDR